MIEAPKRGAGDSDLATRHRVRVRAVATAIADRPSTARRLEVPPEMELRGTVRQRRGSPQIPAPARERPEHRRWVTALVLLAELGVLAAALWAPIFRVTSVSVTGTRLLDSAEVVRAADVSQSIFMLNGDAVAARVRSIPWVESVTVTTALPASVRIAVREWPPMARVIRDGVEYALAAQGASLRLTGAQAASLYNVPLLLDLRPLSIRTAVTPQLISVLGSAASHFPSVFGVHVVAYEWDQTGTFSLWTSAGWQAVLGDISLPGAISAIPAQLSALSVLRSALSFTHPTFGYVDLEDPATPSVGGTPGLPSPVSSALLSALGH
ncbi:MAG: cell division protein FtsQ/DivIB [Candidatus Dormibacteria bacterium]